MRWLVHRSMREQQEYWDCSTHFVPVTALHNSLFTMLSGWKLEVLDADERRIHRLRLHPPVTREVEDA